MTAEEFYRTKNGMTPPEMMIEFAQYHVKEALKAAADKATCIKYFEMYRDNELVFEEENEEAHYYFPVQSGAKWVVLNKHSILSAYSPSNIK